MKSMKETIAANRSKLCLSIVALVLALVGLILYLTTGIIPGFSTSYSTGVLVALIIGLVSNLIFSFVRLDTLEALPFVAYIISIFIFVASNADYLTAVIRAIDVSRVEASFVLTIVLPFVAAILYAVSFVVGKKGQKAPAAQ